ncbi:MAG: hypothetical protein GY679_02220 [Mycoplasma sp.]|nr:hypothetical protein [Mycoplasma sp.]
MNKKFKKITTLGAMSIIPFAAIISNVSMAKTHSREYVSIVIDGKNLMFQSMHDATNYVMRNKVNIDQKVMVGNAKYLNKSEGIIDPSSIYDYKPDGKSMLPAYKMMNGKYTMSREKALNSFLGRTHLVPQYFDGQEFHEGNSIGLREAKEAILSRQNASMVPFYDVDLGTKKMHINPFSIEDVNALQDEALNIYNTNQTNKNNSYKNVTSTFLLPAQDGGQIGIMPSDPSKGLQIKDLLGEDFSIEYQIQEWIKSKLKVNLKVNIAGPSKNPYIFQVSNPLALNYNISIDKKTFTLNEVSYSQFKKYKNDFKAFFSGGTFWEYFEEGRNDGQNTYKDWSTWAKLKKYKTLFGGKLSIDNMKPWKHGSTSGMDIRINANGTYETYYTKASLTFSLKSGARNSVEFNKFIKQKIKKNPIFNKLCFETQNKLLELFKQKYFNSNTEFKKMIPNNDDEGNIKTISSKKDNIINKKAMDPRKNQDFEDADFWDNLKTKLKNLNEKVQSDNFSNFLNKYKQILILNGTPLVSIKKDNLKWKIDKSNREIYNQIYTSYENNTLIYNYNKENDYWNKKIKNKPKQKDFIKKNEANFEEENDNYKELALEDFGTIKSNSNYSSQIPLLMVNANGNLKFNEASNYKQQMKLAKILTDKSNNKVESINKISKELLFKDNKNLKARKKEINEDFFEPAIIYVIYNNNDEVIDEFKSKSSNLRFDDKETIKNNAKAILSEYIRKDPTKVFVERDGKFTQQPIDNKIIMVYNLKWQNKEYTFNSFENVKRFIQEWVKANSKTIVVKG